MKRLAGVFLFLALAWVAALAAAAPIDIAHSPLGLAGSRVPPNLLLNLSLTHAAAAAAYPGSDDYARGKQYSGYFNARMCYRYPMKRKAGSSVAEPDLSEASAYFSISKPADAMHECGGDGYSGNFLNWASASVLDIVRYGLTGGDRVIDEAGRTVLQRAYLPDGKVNPDFYAHPLYFPRKVLRTADGASAPLQVTPFDTPVLYIVSCRNRILFSNSGDGGDCDTPRLTPKTGRPAHGDKYFGEYLARVKVCDASESLARADLCMPYGRAHKPAGSIQRAAGKLRIGLVSYLTEHGAGEPNLYGGVLRAPLEYIGQEKYAGADFIASPNDHPEWSGASGILSATPGGVMRYINLLGRSTPARRGVYKNADPLGELYYEALRYLQGRQASPGAPVLSSDDSLPLAPAWSDPVVASCQRNVILTIGNADTVEDRYVPGNTRTDYLDAARGADTAGGKTPTLDVMEWTRRVGQMEADLAGAYGNRHARPGLLGLDRLNTGDAGRGTYYMAGLAYWAHAHAIRGDTTFRVDNYVLDLDAGGNGAAGDGNPRGTRPRDSQLYLAAKYGGFHDRNQDGNPFQTAASALDKAVVSHAEWSVDGHDPAHYFLGSEPAALIAAIRAAFAAAGAMPGSIPVWSLMAAPAAGEEAYLFQSEFAPSDGSGSLARLAFSLDTDGRLHIGNRLWEAGEILTGIPGMEPPLAGKPAPALRKIYTLNKDAVPATIPLEWGRLSEAQRGWLDTAPALDGAKARAPDGLGAQRLAYLRGERSREVGRPDGVFRNRASLLGGTMHGKPLYVGVSSAAVAGADYAAFYARNKTRRKMVYLGGNDGMLHGFDAAGGVELFAYVPDALLAGLNELASTHYRHRPYLDGAAGVGDALLEGRWRTVLVSGMGAGAQGVFALDVSDPDRFEAGGALWEFTDSDDAAIGNVMAAPAIAKFRTAVKDGVPSYRYFAVFGSGLNNAVDDGKSRGAAAALFLLALDKPPGVKWQSGVNYYKLAIPLPDKGAANGIGPPALVAGADGAVRYAYAGDLQGNLWRIDFTGNAPWADSVGPGLGKKPLFVALDGDGERQPITQQPKVVFAPGGGYLVLFGTGQWIEEADALPSTFRPQSFYAIHDALKEKAEIGGRSALAPRSLDGAAGDAAGLAVTGVAFAYTGGAARQGWYLDFPHAEITGERSVAGATLAAGKIFFNTLLPGRDPCMAAGARSYGLDSLSGFAVDEAGTARSGYISGQLSEGELPAAPLAWEMAASVGARSASGGAVAKKEYVLVNPGQAAPRDGAKAGVRAASWSAPAKRMSWREVANWRELFEAARDAARK